MYMYNDNNQKIGTKTINQGQGLLKPDGSYGNGITMKFNPTAEPKQSKIISNVSNVARNKYPAYSRPPRLEFQNDPNGSAGYNSFLKTLATKKNWDAQQNYDKMNMNMYNQNLTRKQHHNEFVSTLANSKYQNSQNRLERRSMFNDRLNLQAQQFDKTFDFNKYDKDRSYNLNVDKFNYTKNTPKTSAEKNKIDRFKAFSKDPSSVIPQWGELSTEDQNYIRREYINNGNIPDIKTDWGLFNDDYSVKRPTQQPATQYQETRTIGNQQYVKKDGEWYEL